MAKKDKDSSDTLVVPENPVLFWCGALPAEGKVRIKSPTTQYNREPDPTNNGEPMGYNVWTEITANEAWHTPDPLQRTWIGKCRRFQNIAMGDFEFPAFSDAKVQQTSNLNAALVPYPGAVFLLDDARASELARRSREQFFYRHRGARSALLNNKAGIPNKERDIHNPLQNPVVVPRAVFNPATDVWHSEYVYIVRLDKADVSTPQNEYSSLVPDMKNFFRTPPKSVAGSLVEAVA